MVFRFVEVWFCVVFWLWVWVGMFFNVDCFVRLCLGDDFVFMVFKLFVFVINSDS